MRESKRRSRFESVVLALALGIAPACQSTRPPPEVEDGVIALQVDAEDWQLREDRDVIVRIEIGHSRMLEHHFHYAAGTEVAKVADDLAAALRSDGLDVVVIRELGALRIGPVAGLTWFNGEGLSHQSVVAIDGHLQGLGYAVGE